MVIVKIFVGYRIIPLSTLPWGRWLTSSYWGTNAGGKGVRAKGVDGNWNENQGGVSRTERGKKSGSPATSVREFLTGAGQLENQTIRAPCQRLVRFCVRGNGIITKSISQ